MIVREQDCEVVAILKGQDKMLIKLGHLIDAVTGKAKCGDTAVSQAKDKARPFLWIGQVRCQDCREEHGHDVFTNFGAKIERGQ